MNKKIFFIFVILLVGAFNLISAAEQSYCCEKTDAGAYCINSVEENCNSDYQMSPTSCEATSYCKMGTCYDKLEGTCMKNTPQRVCQEQEGIWQSGDPEKVPQCQLGCCLIGDQAAFVTSVRCNRLSSIYGLDVNFRTDLSSELECISSATSDVQGACVFEDNFQNTCKFTTKKDCSQISGGDFHQGFLCSDESLETNCGPTENTICIYGKDEVYFKDSCGNIANIYDANWKNDKPDYWSKVYDKTESCGYGNDNSNSKDCGNCDYYRGSTCKSYNRGEDSASPKQGDNICRDLGCEWKGKRYEHGETWCAQSDGVSEIFSFNEVETDASKENLPGSRYFRLVCYNNDVTIEPCTDYRQQICTESELNGFSTAVCRENRWQECYSQENKQDCENEFRRDCQWMVGVELNQPNAGASGRTSSSSPGGFDFTQEDKAQLSPKSVGSCIPMYSPGFNFWEGNEGETICSQASVQCIVTYEKKLLGDKVCLDGCECIVAGWEDTMNEACISLGDCGAKTNYIGIDGYHDSKAFYSKEQVEEK